MTKAEIHKVVDYLCDAAPYPVKSIGLMEYNALHEVQITVCLATPDASRMLPYTASAWEEEESK